MGRRDWDAQQAQGYANPQAGGLQYPQYPQIAAPGFDAAPAGPSAGTTPLPAAQPPIAPYGMPTYKPNTNIWAGGGPVGSGVVPPDVEAQVLSTFADRKVRQGFVRKVFSIVFLQLLVTVGFSFICQFVIPVRTYVRSTPWPFYLSWGLSFGLLLVLGCNERLRRKHPVNLIFLGLFTICEAFLVGMITAYFNIEVVLLAFLCTCVAVGVLAAIAASPLDITSWVSWLFIPASLLLVLVLVGVFWVNQTYFLVIAGVAALLSSVYLVIDLQLIMGGKQYAISPDEYVFAALSLYLDVVQLFLWLLYLIGFSTQN